MRQRDQDSDDAFTLGKARVVRDTDKALLVYVEGMKKEIWIPKSVVHDDSEVYNTTDSSEGEFFVKTWFAKNEGWT